MLKRIAYIIVLTLLTSIQLLGCNGKPELNFETLNNAMHYAINPLEKNEASIIKMTAFAYDGHTKTFRLGLEFKDGYQINRADMERIFEQWLTEASSQTSITDWKVALKSYNVQLEELIDSKKVEILATKPIDSTEINLLF